MSSTSHARSPIAERRSRAEQTERQIACLLPPHNHYVQPLGDAGSSASQAVQPARDGQ